MTYGVGMLVRDGLVMIADTRTNAGVDNVSAYRKLHVLEDGPGRLLAVATSGNLSVTQSAISELREETGEDHRPGHRLASATSLFRAAQVIGETLTAVRDGMRAGLDAAKVPSAASMLLGGRIGAEPLRLFHIYSAGNFVECGPDQPYLQIGETKYGKPILDRALAHDTPLSEAVKVGLISFDSTMRSNLAVGRPLDLLAVGAPPDARAVVRRIGREDAYFDNLSARWSMMLTEARDTIPDPPFMAAE